MADELDLLVDDEIDEGEEPESGSESKEQPDGNEKPEPESKGKESKSDKDDRYTALEAGLKEQREQIAQLLAALAKRDQPPAPKDEDEDEDEEPEVTGNLVDELSEKGIDALAKRGVLTKKAAKEYVERLIEKRLASHTAASRAEADESAALIKDYPALADMGSALSQETQRRFRESVARDPKLKGSMAAFRLAAEAASEKLGNRETDRRGRVSAQLPPSRSNASGDEDYSGTLSARQRHVIDMLKVDEKDFREQQKALGTRRKSR